MAKRRQPRSMSVLTAEAVRHYPCGKSRPEYAPPALVRRIVDQARKGAADPLLGTEVGRLRLDQVISDKQLAAAVRYAEVCADYDRLKGLPKRSAASPSYQAGLRRGGGNDAEDEAIVRELLRNGGDLAAVAKGNRRVRRIVRAVERHDDAQRAVASCGMVVFKLLRRVVIYDEPCEWWRRPQLVRGLEALSKHFELTQKGS